MSTTACPQGLNALGAARFQEEATIGAEEGIIADEILAPEGNKNPQGSFAGTAVSDVAVSPAASSTIPLEPAANGGAITRSWTCMNKPSIMGNASSPSGQRLQPMSEWQYLLATDAFPPLPALPQIAMVEDTACQIPFQFACTVGPNVSTTIWQRPSAEIMIRSVLQMRHDLGVGGHFTGCLYQRQSIVDSCVPWTPNFSAA